MYKNKDKVNPILNNQLPLFGILCFCCIFYLSIIVSYWFFIFLLIIPFGCIGYKPNWQQWLLIGLFILIFILLTVFVNWFSLISLINHRPKIIRSLIIQFFDNQYDKETASFIKLILFNIKSKDSWIFYQQTVDLGVVWLICISGFHISLISRINRKIFKNIPKIGRYINIVLIGFYSWILNLTYASLRVLFKLIYERLYLRFQINKFDKLGMIGLTLCLFNPVCFIDYGFQLSFLVCIIANFVSSLSLNNKIINRLLINILAFLVTIPFVIEINHKISLLTFINTFIFTYFSGIVFFYFLLFSWIPVMSIIHRWIIIGMYVLIGNISFSNVYIYSKQWPDWGWCIYYLGYLGLINVVYLIVINNKI